MAQPVYALGIAIATKGTSVSGSVQVADDAGNAVLKPLTMSVINSVPGTMRSSRTEQADSP